MILSNPTVLTWMSLASGFTQVRAHPHITQEVVMMPLRQMPGTRLSSIFLLSNGVKSTLLEQISSINRGFSAGNEPPVF